MKDNDLLRNRKAQSAALCFFLCVCPPIVPGKKFGLLGFAYADAVITDRDINILVFFQHRYNYFCGRRIVNKCIDTLIIYGKPYNSNGRNMNYIGYIGELYRHIQKER